MKSKILLSLSVILLAAYTLVLKVSVDKTIIQHKRHEKGISANKSYFDFRVVHHDIFNNSEITDFILGKQNGDKFRKNDTSEEIVRSVQPRFFEYLNNNEKLCKTPRPIDVLICVYSTPGSFRTRNNIRRTWGQSWSLHSFRSKTIFLLAATRKEAIQKQIMKEAALHKDIIQTDYLDSYLNVSYKGLSMLKWIKNNCNQVSYIVKADDDIYVDIFQIMRVVKLLPSTSRFIIGETLVGMGIIRKTGVHRKEWTVEKELMPNQTVHKPYFYGWVYMFTGTILNELYQAAISTPMFKTDDLYMTGLLAGQLPNLTFYHFGAISDENNFLPTGGRLGKDDCGTICKVDTWCGHIARIDTTWIEQDVIEKKLKWCQMWHETSGLESLSIRL